MKNIHLFGLFPLLLIGAVGCNNQNKNKNDWETYHENRIYTSPVYEPLNLVRENEYPNNIVLVGVPESGIPQTRWDDYDVKLRCWYSEGSTIEYDLKEKNLPISFRHKLGEVGTHEFTLSYDLMPRTWEFKIIENPDWEGCKCYFFDKNNNLIHTQVVGYYQNLQYDGQTPKTEEDMDYQYRFSGWNRSTEYIFEDQQFKATYKSIEKRYYGIKPMTYGHYGIDGFIDRNSQRGQSLVYLGRMYRTSFFHSDSVHLGGKDITLSMNYGDYASYWNEINKVIQDHITYEENSEYALNYQGSVNNMLKNLTYNTMMDDRFRVPSGMEIMLDGGIKIKNSKIDPYCYLSDKASKFDGRRETISVKGNEQGYYRMSAIMDMDVYLTFSYKKIGEVLTEQDQADDITIDTLCKTVYGYHLLILNSYDGPDSLRYVKDTSNKIKVILRSYKDDDGNKIENYIDTDVYNANVRTASKSQFFVYYVQKVNSQESSLDSSISTILGKMYDEIINKYTSSNFQNFLLLSKLNIEISDLDIDGYKIDTNVVKYKIQNYANQVTEYERDSEYLDWVNGTLSWSRPDGN